jgi:hypothetical protein
MKYKVFTACSNLLGKNKEIQIAVKTHDHTNAFKAPSSKVIFNGFSPEISEMKKRSDFDRFHERTIRF